MMGPDYFEDQNRCRRNCPGTAGPGAWIRIRALTDAQRWMPLNSPAPGVAPLTDTQT